MRNCTVRTVQGIGDIFWVYQKLYPLFDEIGFVILYIEDTAVQFRAMEFVSKWEKVRFVNYEKVSYAEYQSIMKGENDLQKIIDSRSDKFNYCCNHQLETGISLYKFDNLPVAKNLEMPYTIPEGLPENFILLYRSGNVDGNNSWTWKTDKWLELLNKFYDKYGIDYPLVMIGASYDEWALNEIANSFKHHTITYINRPQEEVIGIMKKCKYFISYQSGLSILADNFDIKQLMIYFPYLNPMKYTWCKPENARTIFHAELFDSIPSDIIKRLPDDLTDDLKRKKDKIVKVGHGAGDIMASIPYIKAMGGKFLHLVTQQPNIPDWHPVNHGGAQMLIPFLRSQGLDGKVITYNEAINNEYDIDMDARTKYNWNGALGDIYTWNSLFFGVFPDMTKPFLHIDKVEKQDIIVFARTARFNNLAMDYTFLNTIDKRKIFIGTEGEVNYLKQCFPNLKNFEYYKITDFLDAAKLMKSAKLFISNQTSFAVLAEGLGIPRVLEICPEMPSVIPKTQNGRPVITQRNFENAIIELLNK